MATTGEQATTTFAPDWEAIATQARDRWEHVGGEHWHDSWLAVVKAHGYVVVRRVDVQTMIELNEFDPSWERAEERLKTVLEAFDEEAP